MLEYLRRAQAARKADEQGLQMGGAVSKDKVIREYYTHGAFGQFPFSVIVTKTHFMVLGRAMDWRSPSGASDLGGKQDDYNMTIVPRTEYEEVWAGKDPKLKEAEGNTVLIRLTKNGDLPDWYVFIGGNRVYTFRLADRILKFASPLGKGGIGYPYAICEHGTVRLNEGWIVPNHMLEQENPYEQRHSMYKLKHVGPDKTLP